MSYELALILFKDVLNQSIRTFPDIIRTAWKAQYKLDMRQKFYE